MPEEFKGCNIKQYEVRELDYLKYPYEVTNLVSKHAHL